MTRKQLLDLIGTLSDERIAELELFETAAIKSAMAEREDAGKKLHVAIGEHAQKIGELAASHEKEKKVIYDEHDASIAMLKAKHQEHLQEVANEVAMKFESHPDVQAAKLKAKQEQLAMMKAQVAELEKQVPA